MTTTQELGDAVANEWNSGAFTEHDALRNRGVLQQGKQEGILGQHQPGQQVSGQTKQGEDTILNTAPRETR